MPSRFEAAVSRLSQGADVVKFIMVSPYFAIDRVGRTLRSIAGAARCVIDPAGALSAEDDSRIRLATRLNVLK